MCKESSTFLAAGRGSATIRRLPACSGDAMIAVMLTATLASSEQICASVPGLLSLRITNWVIRAMVPPIVSEKDLPGPKTILHVNHVRAVPQGLRDAARLARGHDYVEVWGNSQQLQHPSSRPRLDESQIA